VRQPGTDSASAVTRFARQGLREPQIQTAGDQVLLGSVIHGVPVGRPGGRRRRTHPSASALALSRRLVSARRWRISGTAPFAGPHGKM